MGNKLEILSQFIAPDCLLDQNDIPPQDKVLIFQLTCLIIRIYRYSADLENYDGITWKFLARAAIWQISTRPSYKIPVKAGFHSGKISSGQERTGKFSDRELTRQRKLFCPFPSWGKLSWVETKLKTCLLWIDGNKIHPGLKVHAGLSYMPLSEISLCIKISSRSTRLTSAAQSNRKHDVNRKNLTWGPNSLHLQSRAYECISNLLDSYWTFLPEDKQGAFTP